MSENIILGNINLIQRKREIIGDKWLISRDILSFYPVKDPNSFRSPLKT